MEEGGKFAAEEGWNFLLDTGRSLRFLEGEPRSEREGLRGIGVGVIRMNIGAAKETGRR